MAKHPKKLTTEPLIDVVFELRFQSSIQATNVLPGLLFTKLKPEQPLQIERLPNADMPAQLREIEPNLRYVPLVQIKYDHCKIGVSDYSIAIASSYPYKGWETYKKSVLSIISTLNDAWFITKVERHSLKYVDMIEIPSNASPSSVVNLSLNMSGHQFKDENLQIRYEIKDGNYVKIINLLTNASTTILDKNKTVTGTVLDIDVVRLFDFDFKQYLSELDALLEEIHTLSKDEFFAALSPETINSLGPIYD